MLRSRSRSWSMGGNGKRVFPLLGLVLCVGVTTGLSSDSSRNNQGQGRRLAPCQICRVLVDSFNAGVKRTANGLYTGGDAAWEEENKKKYSNSELRLTEIQEQLCSEISHGKDHCHEFAVNNEDLLEEWWGDEYRKGGEDLFPWLCINKLTVCCKDGHFGPECKPCPGYPANVCSGHGKCKGNGTRKGSGECSCDTGYAGEMCDTCASLFYETPEANGEAIISCSACHKACKNGCTGPGAKSCETCAEGWEFDEELGCKDSNECLLEQRLCRKNEFCQNIEGSYNCLSCDTSCDGCFGDGPDLCDQCAEGYTRQSDKVCMDNRVIGQQNQMHTTRYITYCGLAMVSLIVLQKNAALASVIGLTFGVYIATTEYMLSG